MKNITLLSALVLSLFLTSTAHAELLSEENVKDINETWDDVKSGARSAKNTIKESSKEGYNVVKDAFSEFKNDLGKVKDEVFSDDETENTEENKSLDSE